MEWTVVTVVIAMAGFVAIFIKAAWKLASELQSNTDATKAQTETLNQFKSDNTKDHESFTKKLDNHEGRIIKLENK